ncbi:MAG: bifunctional phosphoglucose/phosphomannose isomerase [archaeon]
MEGLLQNIPEQVREAAKLGNIKVAKADKILVCGMGASGITGDILRDLLKDRIVITNKDYNIPKYTDKNTLVFIISASGETEETISCYKEAKKKTKNIVIITSGGELGLENNAIIIPRITPTRYALHYLFFPMLKILENSGMAEKQNINEVVKVMKSLNKKQVKKLAEELRGKIPIIAAENRYKSVGLRWVQQFNENSKVQAITQTFPELDHNAIEGYERPAENFELIIIRDKKEGKREKRRIEITEKILAKKIKVNEVWMRGKTDLAKIFYTIYFGDYLTYYLGLMNKVNPYENKIILFLKKQMKKHIG